MSAICAFVKLICKLSCLFGETTPFTFKYFLPLNPIPKSEISVRSPTLVIWAGNKFIANLPIIISLGITSKKETSSLVSFNSNLANASIFPFIFTSALSVKMVKTERMALSAPFTLSAKSYPFFPLTTSVVSFILKAESILAMFKRISLIFIIEFCACGNCPTTSIVRFLIFTRPSISSGSMISTGRSKI